MSILTRIWCGEQTSLTAILVFASFAGSEDMLGGFYHPKFSTLYSGQAVWITARVATANDAREKTGLTSRWFLWF